MVRVTHSRWTAEGMKQTLRHEANKNTTSRYVKLRKLTNKETKCQLYGIGLYILKATNGRLRVFANSQSVPTKASNTKNLFSHLDGYHPIEMGPIRDPRSGPVLI